MKNILRPYALISYILAALFLSCCAITDIGGVVDPAYKDFKAKKIIVMSENTSIKEKKMLYATFHKAFKKSSAKILDGLKILPPTRTYSAQEICRIARANNADSILFISVKERSSEIEQAPAVTSATVRKVSPDLTVITQQNNKETKTPLIQLESWLIDAKTGNKIWVADGQSFTPDDDDDYSNLLESVAPAIAEDLERNEIISLY